jgi:hypothetical protein
MSPFRGPSIGPETRRAAFLIAADRFADTERRSRVVVEQLQRGRGVVGLACRQAEPYQETLPIGDLVNLDRKTDPGATEAMSSSLPILRSSPAGAPVSK